MCEDKWCNYNSLFSFMNCRKRKLLEIDMVLSLPSRNQKDYVLNQTLLNALEGRGIRDIYLFSYARMDLEPNAIHAYLIANQLSQRGFTVHGLLTPLDLVWQAIDSKEAHHFYNAALVDFFDREVKSTLDKAQSFIKFTGDKLQGLAKSIEHPGFEKDTLGQAYVDIIRAISDGGGQILNPSIKEKTFTAFIAAKLLSQRNDMSLKESVLRFFLEKKSKEVGQIIWFSHAKGSQKLIKKLRINASEANQNLPGIAVFFLKDALRKSKQSYQLMIDKISSPLFQAVVALHQEIARIEATTGSRLYADPSLKTAALKRLDAKIRQAPNDSELTLKELINEWLQQQQTYQGNIVKTHAELLALHRNVLLSPKGTTRSQHFIARLLRDYGDVILGVDSSYEPKQDEVVEQSSP